jgi:hypothetical protein
MHQSNQANANTAKHLLPEPKTNAEYTPKKIEKCDNKNVKRNVKQDVKQDLKQGGKSYLKEISKHNVKK